MGRPVPRRFWRDPEADPRRRATGETEPAGSRPAMNLEQTVDRAQKEAVVGELGQIFSRLWCRRGRALRGPLGCRDDGLPPADESAGGAVRVAKNKLAKIALKGTPGARHGEPADGHDGARLFPGSGRRGESRGRPHQVNKKLVVLGGSMGATPLDEAGVKAVASMPSREELIASIGRPSPPRPGSWWRRSARRGRTSPASSPPSRSARRHSLWQSNPWGKPWTSDLTHPI